MLTYSAMHSIRTLFQTVLFGVLAVGTCLGCASMEQEPKTQLALDVPMNFSFSSTDEDADLPGDWESRFTPPNDSMEVRRDPFGSSMVLGLQPEFRQYVSSRLLIGALATYRLYLPGVIDEYVRTDTLRWWDPVIVQAIALRRSPSAGLLLGTALPNHQQLRVQVTGFYASLAVIDFEGVNRPDKTNKSTPVHREVLKDGWGIGLGFDYRPFWADIDYGSISLSLDCAPSARSVGIGWRFTIPLYGSKQTLAE